QSLSLRRDSSSKSGWGGLVGRAYSSLQPDEPTQRMLSQVFTQETLAAVVDYCDDLRAVQQAVETAHPPEGAHFRRAHRQLESLVGIAMEAAEALHRHLDLSLMVPEREPKNRQVRRMAKEMSQAELYLERCQERQQWETVKFAEAIARVMDQSPGMARALRMPLQVEQALLGLSAGE
ncbi:MAG: hypothetical protein ACE5Q6_19910, partial [Dehalococcoidia bacterium]